MQLDHELTSLPNNRTVGNKAREHLRDSKHKLDQSESDLSASYIMLISGLQLESSHHCLRGEYVGSTCICIVIYALHTVSTQPSISTTCFNDIDDSNRLVCIMKSKNFINK